MMSAEQWDRVKELFAEALDLDASRRASFPDPARTDPDIWLAVRELIDAHDRVLSDTGPESPRSAAGSVFENGQLVAGRYRILQVRGRGGMGEVYKAFDERLRVTVALKTIRSDWSGRQEQLARFEREIRVAREVSHPNLCRVFDLVEHAAEQEIYLCLTMEWLQGETLQEHLQHSRPWDPLAALPVLHQIASALDALHGAGIIHRDLKPGNIMLVPGERRGPSLPPTIHELSPHAIRDRVPFPQASQNEQSWRAVVTDFGLAKSSAGDEVFESSVDAQAGAPYFMAPEQLQSQKPTPVSDIYAFGLIIDEMVTASRAFDGESIASIYYQKLHEAPNSPARRNPALPAHWSQVILRCLDRLPSNRFATAADAVNALQSPDAAAANPLRLPSRFRDRYLIAAAILLLVAVTALLMAAAAPRAEIPIVVFRIRDLTADPAFSYLSTGLTAELVNHLLKLEGVVVKPFRGDPDDHARQKLEDRFLLDGDLQKHANRIRLNVRLSDRSLGGSVVWADSVDRDLENPLAFQTEVIQNIVPGLHSYLSLRGSASGTVQLAGIRLVNSVRTLWQVQPPAVPATQNPVAFHAYLRALHLLEERRPESARAAIQSLKLAVSEDPGFALAFAALADAYRALLDMKQGSQEELRAQALDYAQKAVGFNPNLPEAHTALAATRQLLWDWEGSERSYREAIRLAPKSPVAYRRLGGLILQFGRMEEALELYRKGLELDPYDYPAHSAYGMALQVARRLKDAENHLKWTLTQRDLMSAHVNLGPVYAAQGQSAGSPEEAARYFDLALAEAETVAKLEIAGAPAGTNPKTPSSDYMFAMFHAMRGDTNSSRTALARMLQQQDMSRDSPVSLALVYGMLRDADAAIFYLREAAKIKDRGLLYLKVLPLWDPIREHRGYTEIVTAMRL